MSKRELTSTLRLWLPWQRAVAGPVALGSSEQGAECGPLQMPRVRFIVPGSNLRPSNKNCIASHLPASRRCRSG